MLAALAAVFVEIIRELSVLSVGHSRDELPGEPSGAACRGSTRGLFSWEPKRKVSLTES